MQRMMIMFSNNVQLATDHNLIGCRIQTSSASFKPKILQHPRRFYRESIYSNSNDVFLENNDILKTLEILEVKINKTLDKVAAQKKIKT